MVVGVRPAGRGFMPHFACGAFRRVHAGGWAFRQHFRYSWYRPTAYIVRSGLLSAVRTWYVTVKLLFFLIQGCDGGGREPGGWVPAVGAGAVTGSGQGCGSPAKWERPARGPRCSHWGRLHRLPCEPFHSRISVQEPSALKITFQNGNIEYIRFIVPFIRYSVR